MVVSYLKYLRRKNHIKFAQEDLIQKAIDEFGITHSFESAGFILPDGGLLDFSEGTGGIRTLDHRAIIYLMEDQDHMDRGSELDLWMRLTGMIRVSAHRNYILFDMEQWPTPPQLRTIKDYLLMLRPESVGISVPGQSSTEVLEGHPSYREVAKLIG